MEARAGMDLVVKVLSAVERLPRRVRASMLGVGALAR
jgi:hypothetical protein